MYLFFCSQISVTNNPALPQTEVEITNTLLIDTQVDNVEIAMRFSTPIRNGDVFYTDVNGMQVRGQGQVLGTVSFYADNSQLDMRVSRTCSTSPVYR